MTCESCTQLRAELAEAKAEIGRLERDLSTCDAHAELCDRIVMLGHDLAAERAAREKAEAERSANNSAFVEMNAVFEAVMKAIRGEYLSDFELSHGAVYEAQMLRDVNAIHVRDNAALKAERDELALLTVPSDEDAQVAGRLRIAEARVESLETMLVRYAETLMPDAHEWTDDLRKEMEQEGRAILAARSAKEGAKQ